MGGHLRAPCAPMGPNGWQRGPQEAQKGAQGDQNDSQSAPKGSKWGLKGTRLGGKRSINCQFVYPHWGSLVQKALSSKGTPILGQRRIPKRQIWTAKSPKTFKLGAQIGLLGYTRLQTPTPSFEGRGLPKSTVIL